MDGVLGDFVKLCCKLHNREDPYKYEINHGNFAMDQIWGMSLEEFYKPLQYDFWRNIEVYPEAAEILNLVISYGKVSIATSPSVNVFGCCDAKRDWTKEHFPYFVDRLIFIREKWLIATPYSVLIDDYDKNIDDFRENGGHAILVPKPWNSLHNLKDIDLIEYINTHLIEITKGQK